MNKMVVSALRRVIRFSSVTRSYGHLCDQIFPMCPERKA